MSYRSLAVCVVHHNGPERLLRCVESVLDQGSVGQGDILVVDEASTDRSLDVLRRFPDVVLLANDDNRGPAHARNAAFRAHSGRRILFVDNDVVLAGSCLRHLERALDEAPSAVAAMPRVLHAQNPTTIQYDGAFAHFLGHMGLHNSEASIEGADDRTRFIGSIVTACFLLDRERWGDELPFDERYVFSFEDHDFGLRSRGLGHELLSVATARCFHGTGTPGLSFRRWQAYPDRRVVYHIRNRWWTLLKNYQGRTLLVLAPAMGLYEGMLLLGCIRKRWLGHYWWSIRETARELPYLLDARRANQRRRRVPDRALLAGGPLPFRPGVAVGRVERALLSLLDWIVARYWMLAKRMI